jgi:predicted transposase/invertase (TIGR01784 family)
VENEIIIKPTSDLFIAALWSAPENEPTLRSLINAVMTNIGQPAIRRATVQNPYNIQEFSVDKQICLDVRVEDETGAIYDVEVQTEHHTAFTDRILNYWADAYGSQLLRGEDYVRLRPVRSIVITEFPIFPQLQQIHTVFEIRSRENPSVLLSEHCQIHFLRLGNLKRSGMAGLELLGKDLQRWLSFWAFGNEWEEEKMSALLQDSPVWDAYKEYKRFSVNPEMRQKEFDRQRFLKDQRLNIAYAWAELSEEIARNLKAMGLSMGTIVQATGLSESEIEALN